MNLLLDQDLYAITARFLLDLGHQELARVLSLYSEDQLKNAFVVVEAGRHRFRILPR
jgi:hypothetical protein